MNTSDFSPDKEPEPDLIYAYIIFASFMMLIALGFGIIWVYNGCRSTQVMFNNDGNVTKDGQPTYASLSGLMVALGIVLQFTHAIVEMTYFSLLFMYLVTVRDWNTCTAINLQATAYITYTLSRLVGSMMSCFAPAIKIMCGNIFFTFVGLIVQAIFTTTSDRTMWYASVLVSIGLSCMESSILSWMAICKLIPMNNDKTYMSFSVSWTLGSMVGPPFLGVLMINYGEAWYNYTLITISGLNFILFLVMYSILRCSNIFGWNKQISDVDCAQSSFHIEVPISKTHENSELVSPKISVPTDHAIYSSLANCRYSSYYMSVCTIPLIK